jgi:Cyclin, N-terminal domain
MRHEIHRNLIHRNLLCTKARDSPLERHHVTKDYRTKMVDWMVEVCTSFKCSVRTYFLAVRIFDDYLRLQTRTLENSEVH